MRVRVILVHAMLIGFYVAPHPVPSGKTSTWWRRTAVGAAVGPQSPLPGIMERISSVRSRTQIAIQMLHHEGLSGDGYMGAIRRLPRSMLSIIVALKLA